VSHAHPAYIVLFCQTPPESGGETAIVNSLALYDLLKKEAPGFIDASISKGIAYKVPHAAVQVDGTLGGNGVYKASAFGPPDGSAVLDTGENRKAVERRIENLASRGGWYRGAEDDTTLPNWQRRGFNWSWSDSGDLEVVHRMPGMLPGLKTSFRC
jgi:hypothetical protein